MAPEFLFGVTRGYGLNASGAELIATRNIAKGDVVAVFGKIATLWKSKDVHEFQALADATNNDPCGRNIHRWCAVITRLFFFWVLSCRHIASPVITSRTHTGCVH